MNFDLDKQRHQFGVLLILFILVYSSTVDEPRKDLEQFDLNYAEYYENQCANRLPQYQGDSDTCEFIEDQREQLRKTHYFGIGILVFSATISYLCFSDDDDLEGGE